MATTTTAALPPAKRSQAARDTSKKRKMTASDIDGDDIQGLIALIYTKICKPIQKARALVAPPVGFPQEERVKLPPLSKVLPPIVAETCMLVGPVRRLWSCIARKAATQSKRVASYKNQRRGALLAISTLVAARPCRCRE